MGEHLEGLSGQAIKIAVVDDGVCLNSPDIKGIMGGISIQADPSGKIVVSEDYTTDHCHSHGTACAAIIQRRAPHSELYSIRVLNPSRRCSPEALAIAIRWAATHGMHIVNLSLGTTSQEACSLLRRACREACEAGVILIAAAHPHGLVSYPSSLPEAIGVGVERSYNDYEYTYRLGKRAEFFASGEMPFETGSKSSTSLAAARMTGTVALVLERSPKADVQGVRRILIQNAHRDKRWITKREQPDRCKEERYAWIGEAVLFGYDERMRLLVQFSDLLDFKIVGVVDPFRPALSGKDAGEVAGVKPIHVRIGDSLDTIPTGDTVIVGDLREVKAQARRDDPLGEVLWWAIGNNRNVFSLSPIERALWRTLYQAADEKGRVISYPTSPSVEELWHPVVDRRKREIDVPVVGVFGTCCNQETFMTQLALQRGLTREGYNVAQISTEPLGALFRFAHYFPDEIYISGHELLEHRMLSIELSMIQTLIYKEPHILVVGCEGPVTPSIMPAVLSRDANDLTPLHALFTLSFVMASRPDVCILVVNRKDPDAYIHDTIAALESLGRGKVLAIVFPDQVKDPDKAYKMYGVWDRRLSAEDIAKFAQRLSDRFSLLAVCITQEEGREALVQAVIEHFGVE